MSSTPTPYTRQFNFTSFESSNPSKPKPGASLDAEFNAVRTSLDTTQSRLAEIQRDDGALANGVVTNDSLDEELQQVIAAVQGDVSAIDAQVDATAANAAAAAASEADAQTYMNSALASAQAANSSAIAAGSSAAAADGSADAAAATLAAMQAPGGVSTSMLADGAVTTPKIANDAVDYSKVAPGMVIGLAYAEYAANANLVGTIPNDDTIPQITEGVQIVSLTYNVKSATSLLRVRFNGFAVSGTGGIDFTVCLFRAGQNDAIATWNSNQNELANYRTPVGLDCVFAPGSSGDITLSIRIGNSSGSTFRMNGSPASRLWGGTAKATLIVEEIKA